MFDQDSLRETVAAFVARAAAGEDARDDASVAEAVAATRDALASWQGSGARLPASEPLLQAANGLLTALYAANPEGLPFGVRDAATEMLSLLDEAEANGFGVEPTPAPAP